MEVKREHEDGGVEEGGSIDCLDEIRSRSRKVSPETPEPLSENPYVTDVIEAFRLRVG